MVSQVTPYQKSAPQRCAADQWRVDNRLTITEMAKGCRLGQSELSRCFHPVGDPRWRKATLRIRERVRDYTDGAIRLDDWPEAPPPKADAAARALSKENHHAA